MFFQSYFMKDVSFKANLFILIGGIRVFGPRCIVSRDIAVTFASFTVFLLLAPPCPTERVFNRAQ
jgi:hypothetical protein